MKHKQLCALIAAALMSAAAFNSTATTATAQTTAFTYQGQLSNNGGLVSSNTPQSFTFTLFDAESLGSAVLTPKPNPQTLSATVVDGLFTVDLDFGLAFSGQQYWLEIAVNGQTLTPRQRVNTVPVAQWALNSPAGAAGTAGATGAMGATGATGAIGTNGTNGTNGATGTTGPTGATGTSGTNGATGANGTKRTDLGSWVGHLGDAGPVARSADSGTPGNKVRSRRSFKPPMALRSRSTRTRQTTGACAGSGVRHKLRH